MAEKRTIEIFSAGCAVCEEAVRMVREMACPSCDITILDMKLGAVAERAARLGIRSVPAVLVNGELSDCCAGRGPDHAVLRNAGIGQPLP